MESVIVTGSKGLIGSEITKYLLNKGYQVLELDFLLGHDLTNETFVKDYFSKTKANFLVNCFGLNDHVSSNDKRESLFTISLDTIKEYLNVNTIALLSVCCAFAAEENTESKGIVNFASMYSFVSSNPELYNCAEKNIGYVLSKASVPQMTKHLAVHLAPRIRVNCVVPHGVKLNQGEDFEKKFSSFSPMKRLMDKTEVNGIIEYLCSDKSTYMTGSILMIDGGWSIW
ncbi:MAG: SDR family oxidoreductase [Bacteroidetes bacterium]|nr:SDR family oxidoreductase [Bacteroidota bacterium]